VMVDRAGEAVYANELHSKATAMAGKPSLLQGVRQVADLSMGTSSRFGLRKAIKAQRPVIPCALCAFARILT